MTTVSIKRVTAVDELYCQYPGESGPQPVDLELDTRTGVLSCAYNPNVGGATTFDHRHRLILDARIPCLTAEAANAFMAEVLALAQRVLDGAVQKWDGNNHVGTVTAEARWAWSQIEEICDQALEDGDASDTVCGWSVADWFSEGDDATTQSLGITATTTDEHLAELAAAEVVQAATARTECGYGVLNAGETMTYLTGLRDGLRRGYTVEIQAGRADGTIWQALHPAENVTDTGSAEMVAYDTLANQNVPALDDAGPWRVVVWRGVDADISTEPAYILDDQQFHDAVADQLDRTADELTHMATTPVQARDMAGLPWWQHGCGAAWPVGDPDQCLSCQKPGPWSPLLVGGDPAPEMPAWTQRRGEIHVTAVLDDQGSPRLWVQWPPGAPEDPHRPVLSQVMTELDVDRPEDVLITIQKRDAAFKRMIEAADHRTKQRDEARAEADRLHRLLKTQASNFAAANKRTEAADLQVIAERDDYHEWADRLAKAIAEYLRIDIGEHSNMNLPWQAALIALTDAVSPQQSLVLSLPKVPKGTVALVGGMRWERVEVPGIGLPCWKSGLAGPLDLGAVLDGEGEVRVEFAPPREPRTDLPCGHLIESSKFKNVAGETVLVTVPPQHDENGDAITTPLAWCAQGHGWVSLTADEFNDAKGA
jgi:hypothetical protein